MRRVGNLLFLSGVGPRTPGSNAIPGNVYDADGRLVAYDIEAQCRQVFANVRAVLEAAGARWEDLVDVTVYLTDMARDFPAYNRLYAEYFTTAQPCRRKPAGARTRHSGQRRPDRARHGRLRAGRARPGPDC